MQKAEWDTLVRSTIFVQWQVIEATSLSQEAPEENKNLKDSCAILVPSIGLIQYTCGERRGTQIRAYALLLFQYPAWRWTERVTAHLTHSHAGRVAENRSESTQGYYSSQFHGSRTIYQRSLESLVSYRSPTNLLTSGTVTPTASHPVMLPGPSTITGSIVGPHVQGSYCFQKRTPGQERGQHLMVLRAENLAIDTLIQMWLRMQRYRISYD